MNNPPKVTVFMPVYNGEKYLKEAIDSILAQSFTDYEFLIVNDASNDNSVEIIKSYDDKRISFIENETNSGPILTSNKCFDLAKGEYIVRMDQDDISLPRRIEKQVAFMDKNKQVGVCGSWVKFFGDRTYIAKYAKSHKEIVTNMFLSCPFAHPSVILRKSMFNDFNLRYSQLTGEEYELWVRASRHMRLANIPEVLLKYRTSPNQMTKSHESTYKANKIIWKMQLENLRIDISDEELNLHYLLMSEKCFVGNSEIFIKDSTKWFDKIITANNKYQFYDSKIFINLFRKKWYTAFKTITETNSNFNILDIVFKPKKIKYLSYKNKFRLLYRILKKKARKY